ncbi:MAG: SUMF1/EgtB/PvdO family nonheme iron enzyme [bacterium]|nr:SUMF1/EgtB/PvdO family nonheme iron enzyme [bacterium]
MKNVSRLLAILAFTLLIPSTYSFELIDLGVNPETGMREVRVDIPDLPEGAVPLDFVLIPPGKFTMQLGARTCEVTLTHPFFLSKYEVTVAHWTYAGGVPHTAINQQDNYPQTLVNWYECQDFVGRLNRLGVGEFRLPTSAELEYAFKAGESECWMDAIPRGTTPASTHPASSIPLPVTQDTSNAWGIFDSARGVSEWCQDWVDQSWPTEPAVDPQGPANGSFKITAGCNFAYNNVGDRGCCSKLRFGVPTEGPNNYGMRLVMIAPESFLKKWEDYK